MTVSPLTIPASSGWNTDKVAAYAEAYQAFTSQVKFDSKETGGGTILSENRYEAQEWFLQAIWTGLSNDIHDFKILKSRQQGITTEARAFGVFWLGIHDGLRGAMVFDTDAHKEEARLEIEMMISNLPKSVRFPKIVAPSNRYLMTLSNGSLIRFMAAGTRISKSSGVLGRSSGINLLLASELCSWQNPEGIISLKQSLAETYPNRIFIWESTGRGFNEWHDMWEEARADELSQSATFLGWWLKDTQRIERGTAMWDAYGASEVTAQEMKRIAAVKQQYGYEVSREQLAWYRRKTDPTREREEDDPEDGTLIQEQPWCVTADTRIGTSRGILQIIDLKVGDVTSQGIVDRVFSSGMTPIWRVTTHLGYELTGTHHHPLIGIDDEEIPLEKSVGAKVRLSPPKFAETPYVVQWRKGVVDYAVEITPEFARLIGFFMGDGYMTGQGNRTGYEFGITCGANDRDIIDHLHKLIRRLFGVNTQERHFVDPRFKNAKGWTQVRTTSKIIYETFKDLGLLRTDTVKTQRLVHVPDFIWRSPENIIIEFLRGLFETDGFNSASQSRVVLSSKYPDFLADIQLLLLGLGITSLRRDARKRARNGQEYIGFTLNLRQAEAEKFNSIVGFLSVRKRARSIKRERNGAYSRALPLVFEDEVVTAEETDHDEEVFNLTVSGRHWFDANGLLTHNTEEECFIATGSTFFDAVRLSDRMAQAVQYRHQSYKFWPGTDFFSSRIDLARTWRETQLKLWEEPLTDAVYVVAADPAFGHDENNDRSAINVLRCYADCLEQVAEFASGSTPTHQFAWLILSLAAYYGLYAGTSVMMIVELNGPGEAVWREIMELRTAVISGYYRDAARERGIGDMINNIRQYIYTRSDGMTAGHSYHFKTTTQLKVAVMERLRDVVHNGKLLVRSQDTLEEMRSITRDGDTIKAEGRKHDDRAYTMALGVRAWEERLQRALMAGGRTKAADQAKRALSISDQYQLFRQYQLDSFFKQKSAARLATQQMQQRRNWGRRF